MENTLNLQEIIAEHGKWLRGEGGTRADLRDADLRDVNLRRANLQGAILRDADLKRIVAQTQVVPPEGSFIAWKKGREDSIIKLKIPAGAKRLTALNSRKCRAESATVLGIWRGGRKVKQCVGLHDSNFVYEVGKTMLPDSFDDDPRVECSHGIHFFITREEAETWGR